MIEHVLLTYDRILSYYRIWWYVIVSDNERADFDYKKREIMKMRDKFSPLAFQA